MPASLGDESQENKASSSALSAASPRAPDDRAYRSRGWVALVFLAPFGLAALVMQPPFPASSAGALALDSLGWAAFFAYAMLRAWATLYLGGNKSLVLQTAGPYSLCRNPLYLGSGALALAVTAFLGSVLFAGAVAVVAAAYAALVVPAEERLLLTRFGDGYHAYTHVTPRFLPRQRRSIGPAVVPVDIGRWLVEAGRVGRALLFILVLRAIASARPF